MVGKADFELDSRERWVAAKTAKRRRTLHESTSLPCAMAGPWSEEEISRVLIRSVNVLFDKNMEQHKLFKGVKMDVGREGSEPDSDDKQVFSFRRRWIDDWSGEHGSLESVTQILSMPFTNRRAPGYASPCYTLQIYSISISELNGGLKWPLDVFGMVAVRDSVDHNLNIVYYRTRDVCQTLTEKDPYLTLIGPSRAVVLDPGDTMIEVELKVKGKNESEDKYLSFLAEPVTFNTGFGGPSVYDYKSKHSSLSFKLSSIASSVEATIFIRVVEGSWPVGVSGDITAAVEDATISLLEFGVDDMPVGGDGAVNLSRRVVSVGVDKVLDICYYDRVFGEPFVRFKAALAGRSYATLGLPTCKLEVLVAWSVVSPDLDGALSW